MTYLLVPPITSYSYSAQVPDRKLASVLVQSFGTVVFLPKAYNSYHHSFKKLQGIKKAKVQNLAKSSDSHFKNLQSMQNT
jgi:hypothetical protein